MKPKPSPIKEKVYAALKSAPQTVAMLHESTGLSKAQIHAALYNSRDFQTTGQKIGRAVFWGLRPPLKSRPGSQSIMHQVHAALLKRGDAGATAADLTEETGLGRNQIYSAFERGGGRWWKQVGVPQRGQPKTWVAVERPTGAFGLAPVMGRAKLRTMTDAAWDASPVVDADTFGHYEVRYVNEHGYTVCQPCRSKSWARLLQAERGGECVEV